MTLGALLGLLLPSPLSTFLAATRPGRYAPANLDAQTAIAQAQTARGLRVGLSGLSGSEADYAAGQATPDVLVQDLTTARRPVAMFTPNLAPRYDTRPVRLDRAPWGGDQRARSPRVLAGRLNPPTDRTPAARDVAAAYAETHPTDRRLADLFPEE